ncbi:MAG TPA: hypothetical protein DCS07_08275 [Bdellovibrionales bacterium]|nr:MAG: hypothetical protein A2Z97_00440 [Bdellovibrionales bacterium GWB1_52_6]OFZ03237.1 MAG: hypothetical protein A2X97_09930 [Bdellovibrionales bacterium GWA1_52_35]OFZ38250.1 MAG: hypothetical protein A2070_05090 [Bdellovibrionales bacterium GWC1_52_8]HAR42611.1 hypothetical protein [Bdellovibrionales bacterium]HCM40581.1 hypothetical protein [Bdellovibrionales bacterium]
MRLLITAIAFTLLASFNGVLHAEETANNLSNDSSRLRSLPTIKPVPGLYVKGYGIDKKKNNEMHEGLDIQAKNGSPVAATAPGTVKEVVGKHGSMRITVEHGNNLETSYGNLTTSNVKRGTKVLRGAKIGLAGDAPLFYQVFVSGVPVDPLSYILDK